MTQHVDDSTLWSALGRALVIGGSLGSIASQWQGIARYAAHRGADPTPARAQILRTLFSATGIPRLVETAGATEDTVLLAEAGRVLGDAVRADAGRPVSEPVPATVAAELLHLCLRWFDEDTATAAPLLGVFTGHAADIDDESTPVDPELLARLTRWFGTRLGFDTVLERVVVLSGGFSRLMLDVRWRAGQESGRCVVRIEQGGMFATDGAREVEVMRAIEHSGYPVPAVLWEERDPDILGNPFFVMEHVAGAARVDDEGLDDVLRSVRDLHGLEASVVDRVANLDGLPPRSSPERVIAHQLQHWKEVYRASTMGPVPLLERGFAWLEVHLRPTGPSVVVHGDPGPGNVLHSGDRVSAVIDWEFTHAGDAAEDWSYLALIRGRRIMSPPEWKQRLATRVGVTYDERTWNSWEAYNGVKGACVNLTALDVFSTAARPTPDQLAIGVAVHLRFLGRVVDLTGARA